jgi:anti-sigma factor RsiW
MINVRHRVQFMLDHHWAPGHMSEYLDDELASPQRRRMERHAGECPECRAVLRSLGRMLAVLHQLPIGNDAPDLANAVRRRLRE